MTLDEFAEMHCLKIMVEKVPKYNPTCASYWRCECELLMPGCNDFSRTLDRFYMGFGDTAREAIDNYLSLIRGRTLLFDDGEIIIRVLKDLTLNI